MSSSASPSFFASASNSERTLSFFEGRKGDVISRLPSGKVVLIHKRATKKPQPRETWLCKIEERERYCLAVPLQRLVLKKVPRLVRFKCGHFLEDEWSHEAPQEVWLPEDEEPEPVIRDSVLLCPKCKEDCEVSSQDDFEKRLEEFREKLETDREYVDISEQLNEIEEQISELAEKRERLTETISNGFCICGAEINSDGKCAKCGKIWYKQVSLDSDVVWTKKNRGEPRTSAYWLPEPKEVFWGRVAEVDKEIEKLKERKKELLNQKEKRKERIWEVVK